MSYADICCMIRSSLMVILTTLSAISSAQDLKTKNIIVITLDGMRWQEVFQGADQNKMNVEKSTKDQNVKEKFFAPSPIERRERLMPFFWNTIGVQGQVYGNRIFNNNVNCANPHWFSYPGYSEMLVGFVDRRIRSNKPLYNPNQSVLEFVHETKGFENKVAVFATWEVLAHIACKHLPQSHVATGVSPHQSSGNSEQSSSDVEQSIGQEKLGGPDVQTFLNAFSFLKKNQPRMMLISFDETDAHAHGGRYDEYLKAANKIDKMISLLWCWIQENPNYKDQTTLLITTDHGRGTRTENSWKRHDRLTAGSGQTWIAAIGPDTAPLGEMKVAGQYWQKQVAKTVAAFLGIEYSNTRPVGAAINSMITRRVDDIENVSIITRYPLPEPIDEPVVPRTQTRFR